MTADCVRSAGALSITELEASGQLGSIASPEPEVQRLGKIRFVRAWEAEPTRGRPRRGDFVNMTTPNEPAPQLESWQSVADYLGSASARRRSGRSSAGARSRQRDARGKVSADPADLDKWREATAERPSFWDNLRLSDIRRTSLPERCYWSCAWPPVTSSIRLAGHPARLSQESDSVIVADERGRELWRYKFEDSSLRLEEDQEEIPHRSPGLLRGFGRRRKNRNAICLRSGIYRRESGLPIVFLGSGEVEMELSVRPHRPHGWRYL